MKFNFFLIFLMLFSLNGCQLSSNSTGGDDEDSRPREINQYLSIKDHRVNGKQVSFKVYFTDNGRELSHNEWLSAMTKDPGLKIMRGFAQAIAEEKLDKCGFGLTADPQSAPFYFQVKGDRALSCQTSIMPGQSYDADHSFKTILSSKTGANNIKSAGRAFAFDSISMTTTARRLIIPSGPYVTIVDFAKSANAYEVQDFFAAVLTEAQDFASANKSFSYEVHTGSNYAQSVPHFHLRMYEN